MLTYSNINDILETFASQHAQIRNSHEGSPFDIDEIQNVNGAYMVYEIGPITGGGEQGADWRITVFFMSQVGQTNQPSNEREVKNEAILQAMDLLSYWNKYAQGAYVSADQNQDIEFDKDTWSIDPFKERFNSLYAGAMLTFDIRGTFDYNRCAIPINP